MKKITLALCCLLLSICSYASHITSDEIRYEYTGTGNVYRIIVTDATGCNSVSAASTMVVSISSSCSATFNRTLPQISTELYQTYCPTYPNSCSSGSFPAFYRTIYMDTVSLPPCANWKIWLSLGTRNALNNLQNASGENLFVDAELNNLNAPNSSPYVTIAPYHILAVNSNNSIPFYTIDADNDSLVYEWYQPLGGGGSGIGTPISYTYTPNNTYSVNTPTGSGVVSINPTTQMMYLPGGSLGKYSLALRIKDYRNGVLVGYSSRDFMVTSLNISPVTTPLPTSTMHYNTCPGTTNNITLNFADSIATDSVYTDVSTPTIPGFSFTVTNSPGVGTGSTNITWTTPSTLNPATLPYFYIHVKARNNACPNTGVADYAVLIRTQQCNTDTVWAGDANADYIVNNYDPLAVAVAYNKTGPLRPGASTVWQAQYCPNWTDTFANGVNIKHADCNGDGIVDTTDLAAINANFGDFHVKPGIKAKTTGVPDLYFDITGINFNPGATVAVPIKLGSAANMMNNIYGLASDIAVGGITLTSPLSITYPTSWIGNASNTLHFNHFATGNNNGTNWAYSRTDHQNVSGQGTIAMLNLPYRQMQLLVSKSASVLIIQKL